MTMNKRFLFFILLNSCMIFGLWRCGYLSDMVTGVEKTPSLLTGQLIDSLSNQPISGATVRLDEVSVQSDSTGFFQMTGIYTGSHNLTIEATGYANCSRQLSLTKDPLCLDKIRLQRNNHKPSLRYTLFPLSGYASAPLRLQIKCVVADSDFLNPLSIETVHYTLYLGGETPPPVFKSGCISSSAWKDDSCTLVVPDSLIHTLLPSKEYYWQLLLVDRLGDSLLTPLDSFWTRDPFSPCPDEMVLVEKRNLSFCMDKYEVTNQQYERLFDAGHIDKRSALSAYNQSPVTGIMDSVADAMCKQRTARLCTIDEWQAAAGGYAEQAYPYGEYYDSTKCNTKDPYKGTDTVGAHKACVSVYGIYDLSGNAAEWVRYDEEALYLVDARKPGIHYYYYAGGSWASRENSGMRSIENTQALSKEYIGFRCCLRLR